MSMKKKCFLGAFCIAGILLVLILYHIQSPDPAETESSLHSIETLSTISRGTIHEDLINTQPEISSAEETMPSGEEELSRAESHFASLASQDGIEESDLLPEVEMNNSLEIELFPLPLPEEIDWIFNGNFRDTFMEITKLALTEHGYTGKVTIRISEEWELDSGNAMYHFTVIVNEDKEIPLDFDMSVCAFTYDPKEPDTLPEPR